MKFIPIIFAVILAASVLLLSLIFRIFYADWSAKSWRTTSLGIAAIAAGLWCAWNLWIPYQSVRFNLLHVLPNTLALLIVGWALIHARDHRAK